MNLLQSLSRLSWLHVCLIFLGLMLSVPFLYWSHAQPVTAFFSEWYAAALGVGALFYLVLGAHAWRPWVIPRVALLPLGFLLIAGLHVALGKTTSSSYPLLYASYLVWAMLLMVLGRQLKDELGLAKLTTVLALGLLVGAQLNAFAGLVQYFNWNIWPINQVVTRKVAQSVYGNLAQPNHFANQLTLGLISLGLLHAQRHLRLWLAALVAAPLLFTLVVSGSRSVLLYLLCITALALFWQRRDKVYLALSRYSMMLLFGFIALHLALELPTILQTPAGAPAISTAQQPASSVPVQNRSTTSFQRIANDAEGSSSVRWNLWHGSWHIFTLHPVLGSGIGTMVWEFYHINPQLRDPRLSQMNAYAHNIVLQTAAEMGALGLAVLFATIGLWLRQAWRDTHSIEHWWGYGILAVIGIHSMVEYPQCYAYFLGVLALLLGMFDATSYRLQLGNAGKFILSAVLVVSVYIVAQLFTHYTLLEQINARIPAAFRQPESIKHASLQRLRNQLTVLGEKDFLLRGYVNGVLSSAEWDHQADHGQLNAQVFRFLPVDEVAYRQVFLLAFAGQVGAARDELERAIWTHPHYLAGFMNELREMAQHYPNPERFTNLLNAANEIAADRQNAALHPN